MKFNPTVQAHKGSVSLPPPPPPERRYFPLYCLDAGRLPFSFAKDKKLPSAKRAQGFIGACSQRGRISLTPSLR